jgi:hypothetical protein
MTALGTYSPSTGGTEVRQVLGHCCCVPLGGANCPRRQLTHSGRCGHRFQSEPFADLISACPLRRVAAR